MSKLDCRKRLTLRGERVLTLVRTTLNAGLTSLLCCRTFRHGLFSHNRDSIPVLAVPYGRIACIPYRLSLTQRRPLSRRSKIRHFPKFLFSPPELLGEDFDFTVISVPQLFVVVLGLLLEVEVVFWDDFVESLVRVVKPGPAKRDAGYIKYSAKLSLIIAKWTNLRMGICHALFGPECLFATGATVGVDGHYLRLVLVDRARRLGLPRWVRLR